MITKNRKSEQSVLIVRQKEDARGQAGKCVDPGITERITFQVTYDGIGMIAPSHHASENHEAS